MARRRPDSVHDRCRLLSALGSEPQTDEEQETCVLSSSGNACHHVLDLMLENLCEPVFLQDQAGRLLHANQPFADLFRKPLHELHGMTLDQLLVEQPLEIQVLSDVIDPEQPGARRCDVVISHAPGELRELVIVTRPLDGNGAQARIQIGSVADVTEARHSQRLVEQLT